MKGQENIFKKYYDSFRNMDGHFHILEHRVPVEEQIAYFKFSDQVRKTFREMSDMDYEQYIPDRKDVEQSLDDKKKMLSILAISKQVRAYRMLERYVQNPDKELINWAYMALMESRINLETELSGEKQIYISTGLGGKGQKLRFYVLIVSADGKPFEHYQREVIEKEFGYLLSKEDCEIERLTVGDRYVELVYLMPIKTDIKRLLERLIGECNLYGNFLSEMYTITNVKELSQQEVNRIVEKYGSDQAGC
jgi:hypothetical protein